MLKGVDVGPDLVRGAQGLGLVEAAGEADLVAGLDAGRIDDVPKVAATPNARARRRASRRRRVCRRGRVGGGNSLGSLVGVDDFPSADDFINCVVDQFSHMPLFHNNA